MATQEQLIKAKGTKPTILKSKNEDEPSCPKCGHYNAMLHDNYYDGVYSHKCRDCGYTTINSIAKYDCE